MHDERHEEFAFVTPGRNAVDEALGLTEDPLPAEDTDEQTMPSDDVGIGAKAG